VQTYSDHSSLCCDSPQSSPFVNGTWRDRLVRETLSHLDPKWPHLIGYLPLFNLTLSLFDLHLDFDRTKKTIDCTHFLYVPFLFTPFWGDIVKEWSRVSQA
jgi:hypothetical protein